MRLLPVQFILYGGVVGHVAYYRGHRRRLSCAPMTMVSPLFPLSLVKRRGMKMRSTLREAVLYIRRGLSSRQRDLGEISASSIAILSF